MSFIVALDRFSGTRSLTAFFLPHMVISPDPALSAIRVLGSVALIVDAAAFLACAIQVYAGKLLRTGPATAAGEKGPQARQALTGLIRDGLQERGSDRASASQWANGPSMRLPRSSPATLRFASGRNTTRSSESPYSEAQYPQ